MDHEGVFAPETPEAARERHAALAPAATEVVRASAREMGFDSDEYDRRVTDAVRDTARDALFASLLAVRVGTRAEFEEWREEYQGTVVETGQGRVDNVAWHVGPTETALAAPFQDEREAAVAALRQQAFGRLYAEVVG